MRKQEISENVLNKPAMVRAISDAIKPDTEVIQNVEAAIDVIRPHYLQKDLDPSRQDFNDRTYRRLLAQREEWIETGRIIYDKRG